MNLLLLLSALLSALTGVGSAVRQSQQAASLSQPFHAAAVIAARRIAVTRRPVQPLATLAASATAPIAAVLALVPAQPSYATRRRE